MYLVTPRWESTFVTGQLDAQTEGARPVTRRKGGMDDRTEERLSELSDRVELLAELLERVLKALPPALPRSG
jgi:hypothetical protein